jgi:hypothetical protein
MNSKYYSREHSTKSRKGEGQAHASGFHLDGGRPRPAVSTFSTIFIICRPERSPRDTRPVPAAPPPLDPRPTGAREPAPCAKTMVLDKPDEAPGGRLDRCGGGRARRQLPLTSAVQPASTDACGKQFWQLCIRSRGPSPPRPTPRGSPARLALLTKIRGADIQPRHHRNVAKDRSRTTSGACSPDGGPGTSLHRLRCP